MTSGEEILVEQCQQGDRKAWSKVYEKYAGNLMTIALRYVPDRERANDIVQDAFIKIFSSFDKFSWRGEGSLKAWMSRITVNLALENLRKKDLISESDDIGNMADEIPDEEEAEQIPPETIMGLIAELPDGYRTVFNLFVFEENSHKEIAAKLGITEQTSASQYHRARAKLAKQIKEYIKRKG